RREQRNGARGCLSSWALAGTVSAWFAGGAPSPAGVPVMSASGHSSLTHRVPLVEPSLFDAAEQDAAAPVAPLPDRMRPRRLDEVGGQKHLLAEGAPLRRLVEADAPLSVVLWGPPGSGKTTLASTIARSTERRWRELSAVTAGVKDVREVV